MAKDSKAEVVQISDHRTNSGDKTDAPAPVPPPELTPEQRAQQVRESRIAASREAGVLLLTAKLRMGTTPAARDVIGAVLELAGRAEQADRLFDQAGQSFNQIAETIGATLGYLAACEQRQRMPWWKRWRTPRPEFPKFGAHVETDGKPGESAKAPDPVPVSATVH